MSVNCIIRLPSDVRLADVARVMGALAGLPVAQTHEGWGSPIAVAGAEAYSTPMPEMARIMLSGLMVDGLKEHECHYAFESPEGERMLLPSSTPFWVAIGRRLVAFFGGSVLYRDDSEGEPEYIKPRPRETNSPEDGPPWQAFQDAIVALKPITEEELADAAQHAALWRQPSIHRRT